MLVLSRKLNEKIKILKGKEVIATITVARLGSERVRLGFEADKSLLILREELIRKE